MGNREVTGKAYDIQGFSVQDGPGIRLTVFLKGCPLRCLWCHSPESQEFFTELNWMEMKCVGIEKCGECLKVCPYEAVQPGKKTTPFTATGTKGREIQLVTVDREKCDNCGRCAEACMSKALYMCGKEYHVEEIMELVRRDKPFFEKDGGGITISGGECLCQPDFVLALLKQCKKESVHTAVDTSGFVNWEAIKSVLPYTDLFLYDLKCMNDEVHRKVTGVSNELILENAKKIAAAGGKMQIRIPTIPGVNDSEESFKEFGRFIFELGSAVEMVQLLPYHNLGVVKWDRLQREPPIFNTSVPDDEDMELRKRQLEAMGLIVSIH